jgi:hypothetical protein
MNGVIEALEMFIRYIYIYIYNVTEHSAIN